MFFLLTSVYSFAFDLDSIPITVHSFPLHHAECYCLSRHVLTVPSLSTTRIQFACLELISCDWSTNLALGILESHCRFQLLSIKRFGAWCQSQGAIELTIARTLIKEWNQVLVHMLRWIYLRRTIHGENYTRGGQTHKWRHHHRHVAQINSMLRCLCTAVDHSRRQNVVSISRANSAAPRVVLFVLTTFWRHLWSMIE